MPLLVGRVPDLLHVLIHRSGPISGFSDLRRVRGIYIARHYASIGPGLPLAEYHLRQKPERRANLMQDQPVRVPALMNDSVILERANIVSAFGDPT